MKQSVLLKGTKGWGRKPARRLNVKERIQCFSVKKWNACHFKWKEKWYVTVPAEGRYQEIVVLKLTIFSLSLVSPHNFEIKWPHSRNIFRFMFGHVAYSLHYLSTRNSTVFPLPPNFAGTRRQTRHLGYFSTSPSLVINRSLWGKNSYSYLSSSCFKALSMFILCPTLVTPRSIRSSFCRFGKWVPSISLSINVSLCSPKFRLSNQSATSGLVHRWTGLVVKGLFEIGCCNIEGEGDLLRPVVKPNKSPEGGWLGRLNTSDKVGEGDEAEAEAVRGAGMMSLLISVGETTGLGACLAPEVLLS